MCVLPPRSFNPHRRLNPNRKSLSFGSFTTEVDLVLGMTFQPNFPSANSSCSSPVKSTPEAVRRDRPPNGHVPVKPHSAGSPPWIATSQFQVLWAGLSPIPVVLGSGIIANGADIKSGACGVLVLGTSGSIVVAFLGQFGSGGPKLFLPKLSPL